MNNEGNSLFGLNVCREITSRIKLHVFDQIATDEEFAKPHEKGVKHEIRKSKAGIFYQNDHTSFLYAAAEGDMEQLRRMVARGVDIDKPDYGKRKIIRHHFIVMQS